MAQRPSLHESRILESKSALQAAGCADESR